MTRGCSRRPPPHPSRTPHRTRLPCGAPPARAAPPRRLAVGPGPAILPNQGRTLPAALPHPRQLCSSRPWPLQARPMNRALGVQLHDQPGHRAALPGRLRSRPRRRPPLTGPERARRPPQLQRPTRRLAPAAGRDQPARGHTLRPWAGRRWSAAACAPAAPLRCRCWTSCAAHACVQSH